MRKRLRQSFAALVVGVGLAAAAVPAAHAQSTWGGTTSTGDYNTATEWTPATAPVAAGQSAIFDTGGTDTVNVSAAIAPDSWTFNANAQSYTISGSTVTFSAGGGIANNASAGQFILIGNDIAGATAVVSQNDASILRLSGNNSYAGGTSILAGTLQVTNNNSVGTGQVLMAGGTFQSLGFADLTFTNDFFVATTGTIDVNSTTMTFQGNITGPGTLTITDTSFSFGTAVLSGNNSLAALNVTGARVAVDNANSIGNGTLTLDNGAIQARAAGLTFFNDVKLNTGGGIFDANGNTLSMAGTISDGNGPGALTIIDSTGGGVGITELAGTNTYTGGTTVTNTTLQVTNNASVGTGTVTLDNARFQTDGLGGNLTFTNNFQINNSASGSIIDASGVTLTIAGNISDGVGGAGKLTVDDRIGGGKVVLLGNNTYTGGTDICNCATLQLGDATHTASIIGDINNLGGRLDVVNANLSGVTSLTNDGGLATFLNATSAASMTINNINGAALFFGSPGGTDTATAGNATIINDGSGIGFLANSTAGNASITNQNGAQLIFGVSGGTDKATAGNATILNDGSAVGFFANTNAGTAKITNQNFAALLFIDQASAASATIINQNNGVTSFGLNFGTDKAKAGTATIINNDLGATVFNAHTSAASATIITNNGGFTSFFDNSDAGLDPLNPAKIVTNDGGQTFFNNNSDGGTAQFITVGTGFVDFSGSLGPNGDGRIHAGSIEGTGIYYIGAGNTLVVGGNNLSTEFKGVIADFNPSPGCGCPPIPGIGNFEKVGTGNLILSGINTYTGSTP